MKSKNEIEDKKIAAISDFDKLCKEGEIGFYTSCEVTQIFLFDKETKNVYNYFTLVTFEEDEFKTTIEHLTKKPIAINKQFSLGAMRVTLKIDEAKTLFNEISQSTFTLDSNKCEIARKLVLLPKQFVSSSWDYEVTPPVGKLLKPNYWGDSYIIEFFSEDKPLIGKLSEVDIDKINKAISQIESITIDLTNAYERVENIVFQFPITILTCSHPLKQTDTLEVTVYTHPKLTESLDLVITAKTSLDNLTTGFSNIATKPDETPVNLSLGDSNKLELNIAKINSDILLHQSRSNYIRSFGGLMMVSMANCEPRTIITRVGEKIEIPLSSPRPLSVGKRKDDFFTQIKRRERQNELLLNSGDCQVFDVKMQNEAYKFVRDLINKHKDGVKEIYLWDPFLRSQDIIDTLYFQNTGVPFKCICSLKAARNIDENGNLDESSEQSLSYEDFKVEELNNFLAKSNNLNVILEFRCQHSNYGTKFHDRFLIFTSTDSNELPVVYSLGTSVNSLGKSHHMIQKVTDARLIKQNFDIMWDKLDPVYCRVLQFPEDLK